MDVTLSGLLTMARDSIAEPREGARRVMGLGLSLREGWLAVALMAVASAVLTHVSFMLSPPEAQAFFALAMASPVRTALIQGAVMAAGAWAMWWFGIRRGGHGTLAQAVALTAWMQFILLVLQVVQLAAQVILPPLAALIGLAGLGLFFWLLVNFVAELHGFRSLLSTLLGVLAVMLLMATVLAMLFSALVGLPAPPA